MDSKVMTLYGHLHDGRVNEAEASLLGLIASYQNDRHMAEMLPGLIAGTVPKILSTGSNYFGHADGSPLSFGQRYTPPEYTMVYLEMIMYDLPGRAPLQPHSAVHRTLSIMWDILLEFVPPADRHESVKRLDSYQPLPDNVVRFRRKH